MSNWKPLVRMRYSKPENQPKGQLENAVNVYLREEVIKRILLAAAGVDLDSNEIPDPEFPEIVTTALEILSNGKHKLVVPEKVKDEDKEEDEEKVTVYYGFEVPSPEPPEPPLLVEEDEGLLRIEMNVNLFDVIETAKISESEINTEKYVRLEELEFDPEKFVASVLGADSPPCGFPPRT